MIKLTNKAVNTFFIILFVFFNIFYTAFRLEVTSLVGLIMLGSMLVVDLMYFIYVMQHEIKDLSFILCFLICLFFHKLYAETSVLTIGLVLSVCVFYKALCKNQINAKAVAVVLISLFLIIILLSFADLIKSLTSASLANAFSGIFMNPNTMGAFSLSVFMATFLFIKNKKIRLILSFLFILCIIGCKSRNLLLFFLLSVVFFLLLRQQKSKLAVISFCLVFIGALFYMLIIEPQSISEGMEIMGKEGGSSGRSTQIWLTITRFPLTLFGVGYDVPNDYVVSMTGYAIHNFYVNTTYAMGFVFMFLYMIFIIKIYVHLKSTLTKAFILSSHLYFLFEPGMAFSVQMLNCFPIIFILLKLNQEYYENRSLHF